MESNKKEAARPRANTNTEPHRGELATRLLEFFDRVARDLPWRRRRDAYGVWISEVMLQQTQVGTVVPRYRRFLERFPAIKDLAAAELGEVLAEWAGLGYYRRARQLHEAARAVVRQGTWPRTAAGLAHLPGIGAYTAAAVASMAFGERIPVLDGNVERVLCRFLALAEDPKTIGTRRRLEAAAFELLTAERPGDGNQALMELGATVCKPAKPECPLCPLREACAGQQTWELYPRPRQRRATERHDMVVALVEVDGEWLVFRRSEDQQVLAGFWELPTVPAGSPVEVEQNLATTYGGRWSLGSRLLELRHAITYRDLRLVIHQAQREFSELRENGQGHPTSRESRHVAPAVLGGLATSSLVGKIIRAVANLELARPETG